MICLLLNHSIDGSFGEELKGTKKSDLNNMDGNRKQFENKYKTSFELSFELMITGRCLHCFLGNTI